MALLSREVPAELARLLGPVEGMSDDQRAMLLMNEYNFHLVGPETVRLLSKFGACLGFFRADPKGATWYMGNAACGNGLTYLAFEDDILFVTALENTIKAIVESDSDPEYVKRIYARITEKLKPDQVRGMESVLRLNGPEAARTFLAALGVTE